MQIQCSFFLCKSTHQTLQNILPKKEKKMCTPRVQLNTSSSRTMRVRVFQGNYLN